MNFITKVVDISSMQMRHCTHVMCCIKKVFMYVHGQSYEQIIHWEHTKIEVD